MEWDQIADGWAAMTDRLRGARIESPRNFGGPQETSLATNEGDGRLADTKSFETLGNDRRLPTIR